MPGGRGGGGGANNKSSFIVGQPASQVAKNADGKVRSSARLAGSITATFPAQKHS